MALDPKKYINSKEKTFSVLCNMKVLFDGLSERWQVKFLESLNENPVRIIIEDKSLSFSMIRSFDDFEKHFCYLPVSGKKRVYVVEKSHVPEVYENLIACITNDFWTNRCYKLN